MRPTRFCGPAPATRATARCSTSAARSRSATAISPRCWSAWPAAGRYEYVEWPADKKAIDIGSFYADSRKFSAATGWTPAVSLDEGLRRTIAFYREHFEQYVDGDPGAHETVNV